MKEKVEESGRKNGTLGDTIWKVARRGKLPAKADMGRAARNKYGEPAAVIWMKVKVEDFLDEEVSWNGVECLVDVYWSEDCAFWLYWRVETICNKLGEFSEVCRSAVTWAKTVLMGCVRDVG